MRTKWGDLIDEKDPAFIKAAEEMDNIKPMGGWLHLLGYKDWKIESLLAAKEVRKNGIYSLCTKIDRHLSCSWEEAKAWDKQAQGKG